jgi:hypothetical protein
MYVNTLGHGTTRKRAAKTANVTAERMAMALNVGFGCIALTVGE